MKNNLRVERAKCDWTQEDLANQAGVSRQTINAIEAGNYNPSTKLALRLSELFNCSVNDLFELEDRDRAEDC